MICRSRMTRQACSMPGKEEDAEMQNLLRKVGWLFQVDQL